MTAAVCPLCEGASFLHRGLEQGVLALTASDGRPLTPALRCVSCGEFVQPKHPDEGES